MKSYLKYLLILPLVLLCCIAVIFSYRRKNPVTEPIRAVTESDRSAWLMLQGWKGQLLSSRPVTVPSEINELYTDYANLQNQLHLPLMQYAGQLGVVYTYQLDQSDLYAELLTADGILIGAQCYYPENPVTLDMHGRKIN